MTRATLTSSSAEALPSFSTELYTSWAKEADAVMVRPATTARMVAKATPEITPMNTGPPSASASNGAAEFWRPGASLMTCWPTISAAPMPRIRVSRKKMPISTIAHTADLRASLAVGTV